MDLAQRFSEVRREHPLQFHVCKQPGLGEFAYEIISNHATLDEPAWEGFEVNSNGENQPISPKMLEHIRDSVQRKRARANFFTHWKLAMGSKTKGPLLVKVDGNFAHVDISVFDWTKALWDDSKNTLTDTHLKLLDKLHREVLWKSIFTNTLVDHKSFISLIFAFKAGDEVLGIWVIHGAGSAWIEKISTLIENENHDCLQKNLWPLMIFLSSYVASRLAHFTGVTGDVTRLAYNSLRPHELAFNEIEFKEMIQSGTINETLHNQAKKITDNCNRVMGRHRFYETAFDLILISRMKEYGITFSKDFIKRLRHIFVCWHLLHLTKSELFLEENDFPYKEYKDYIKQIKEFLSRCEKEDFVSAFWECHCEQLCQSEQWYENNNARQIIDSLKKLIFVEDRGKQEGMSGPGER